MRTNYNKMHLTDCNDAIYGVWAKYRLQITGKFILHKQFCVVNSFKVLMQSCLFCFSDQNLMLWLSFFFSPGFTLSQSSTSLMIHTPKLVTLNCCDKQLILLIAFKLSINRKTYHLDLVAP